MTRRQFNFKYVHKYVDRHGKPRAYYKPPIGKNISLPVPVGSDEFLIAYTEARRGGNPAIGKVPSKEEKGTFNELLAQYFRSPKYKNLSASSQKNYARILRKFCERYGDLPVSEFKTKHATSILGKMSSTPEAANTLMKRLRTLLTFGVKIEMIGSNPISGIEEYSHKEDGYHTLTDEEISQFIRRHPSGTKAYLALMLMLYTGQRKSDATRMGWHDVNNGQISVKQRKTKTPLQIPLSEELSKVIANIPKDAPTFLMNEYGNPFSVGGFGNWMRKRFDEAGLAHCSSHGLRKACARRLAEAGCTNHEISAITGHRTDAEIRRYTRKSDQKLLAGRAVEKLRKSNIQSKSANHCNQVSKQQDKIHAQQ
jgi:integrase